jgi:uncharacterized protein (TIGR00251 family)
MHIKVKVIAGAKREKLIKKSKDALEVHVREPAEDGMANKKALELLRKEFAGYNEIKIIHGHHSPNKIISIEK